MRVDLTKSLTVDCLEKDENMSGFDKFCRKIDDGLVELSLCITDFEHGMPKLKIFAEGNMDGITGLNLEKVKSQLNVPYFMEKDVSTNVDDFSMCLNIPKETTERLLHELIISYAELMSRRFYGVYSSLCGPFSLDMSKEKEVFSMVQNVLYSSANGECFYNDIIIKVDRVETDYHEWRKLDEPLEICVKAVFNVGYDYWITQGINLMKKLSDYCYLSDDNKKEYLEKALLKAIQKHGPASIKDNSKFVLHRMADNKLMISPKTDGRVVVGFKGAACSLLEIPDYYDLYTSFIVSLGHSEEHYGMNDFIITMVKPWSGETKLLTYKEICKDSNLCLKYKSIADKMVCLFIYFSAIH